VNISFFKKEERSSILTIICDGKPWRDVHTSIFGRRPTFSANCRTIEDLREEFVAMEYQAAKNYALRRLSLQTMLSTALARSLKERLVSENTIKKLLVQLTDSRLINDEEWTASFVRTQTARKVGPRAIAQKLAGKGIKGMDLEQALENSWDPTDQRAMILKLLNSRYAKKNLKDFKEKQKVIASLSRRGFDLSIILEALY
jgi:regulatory protein